MRTTLIGLSNLIELDPEAVYGKREYSHGYENSNIGMAKTKKWVGDGKLSTESGVKFFHFETQTWDENGSCFEALHTGSTNGIWDCPIEHFLHSTLLRCDPVAVEMRHDLLAEYIWEKLLAEENKNFLIPTVALTPQSFELYLSNKEKFNTV